MRDTTHSETLEIAADAANLLRVRHTAMAGTIGFLAALAVDYFLTPEYMMGLLVVRGIVCVALASVSVATGHARFAARAPELSLAGLLFCGTGLIACAIVSHADTGYNASLALAFLATAVSVPLRLASGCIAMGGLILAYALSMVAFHLEESSGALLDKVFLLLLSGGLAGVCLYTKNVLRHRERGAVKREREARLLLRNSNAALQSTVAKLNLANLQLTQLDSAKNQFFANVNHELRTPLMLILAGIESLKDGATSAESNARQYEATRRNSLRLLRMVDDLLELSRLESSSTKLRVADHDLAKLARDLVEQMQPMAGIKGLSLTYEGDAAAIALSDAIAVERVLNNLISNALKFTPSGGAIRVRVAAGDPVQITVVDTGTGVAEADKGRIFERFYQGTGGKKLKGGGVGIGLSMCKRIVEMHQGTIALDGASGVGTSVAVLLPRRPGYGPDTVEVATKADADTVERAAHGGTTLPEWDQRIRQEFDYKFISARDASERRAVPRGENDATKPTSVLIVEDNQEILQLVADALVDHHKIYVASEGQEALALATRLRPDLIISDVMMPGMDGFTLLKELRIHPMLADIPFVLMTARNEINDRHASDTFEADAFLPKPFATRDLRAIVDRLLRRQRVLASQAVHSSDMSSRIAASGLAHDILNPVGFIKSASFLIAKYHRTLVDPSASPEKRAAASDKLLAALQSANAGVERVESAVQQLRKVAEGEGGSEPEPLDINTIIQRTLLVTAETVAVKTALAAKSRALLRPGQFDRVLLNLLLNALEAGGSHCQVEVASADSTDGKFVQVAIKDNGPGMDSDTLSRVAEPYFSTKRRGSGLGLAMCKQIIADHGGHMAITSTLGVGTTFAIDLPCAPLAPPAV